MDENRLNTKKFLNIVPFRKLLNWSVPYLTGSKIEFTTAYPMVRIGDFLSKNKTPITIEDEREYVRVRIKTHNGGVERREKNNVLGKSIGTKKQYAISEGQFIISKIDARNGAMGIVPKELEGAIVTQDFLPYDIDTNIVNPQYLVLVSTTKPFLDFCQSCSSGTTNRQRIDVDAFLSQQIPLPSLNEQKRIVAAYNETIKQVSLCVNQAQDINGQIEEYVNTSLGLKNSSSQKYINGKIHIMHFSQLERWDVWNLTSSNNSAKYPLRLLGKIIKMQSGKFLPSKDQKGGKYNVYGGNGLTGTHNKFCFSGKRIVIGRVGEYCGNVHLIDGNYWITDNALKVDKITDDVTWEYLAVALRTLNINQYKSISAQPSISQTKILQLQIPVPPLNIQKEIVRYITKKKKHICQLQEKAKQLRIKATGDFESKIYK